jgi:hypothetical protein
MTILKGLTIVAAFLAGGTSLATAQNGLPTGGQPPVAGGASGNPIPGSQNTPPVPGAGPAYIPQPGYAVGPGYVAQPEPGYVAQPQYAQPGYVGESGTAAAPGRVATTHQRSMYMYAPPHRTNHTRRITPTTNGGYNTER